MQYYKLPNGQIYAVNIQTKDVSQVSSIPAGSAVINWTSNRSLPPALTGKINVQTSGTSIPAPAPTSTPAPIPPTSATPPLNITTTKLGTGEVVYNVPQGLGLKNDDVVKMRGRFYRVNGGFMTPWPAPFDPAEFIDLDKTTFASIPVLTPVPEKALFKNTTAYKALSSDAQALVDMAFSAFSGTPEQQNIFSNALTQAQTLADPYAKSQLMLSGAEFGLAIARSTNDYEKQAEILKRTQTDIASELKLNKDFLSLEQQSDIARETGKYSEDFLTIADQAAEKGITFGTGARSRALAEERRSTQFQDVIQSTQRKYNFQVKELELKAARGDVDAQKRLDTIQKEQGFELQKIGQSAERVLGSASAGGLGLTGFTPQGGALGDVEQQRRESIIKLAGAAITK